MMIKIDDLYSFGTTPFQHQLEALQAGYDKPAFGYLLEQGLGKTKIAIDNACYLFNIGLIDCVIVVAPNIVHINWIDEIEIHSPDYLDYHSYAWSNKQTISEKKNREVVLADTGAVLQWVTINYEAIIRKNGKDFIRKCLLRYNHIMVISDESQCLRNPGTKRTKTCIALAKKCDYRRILTGTAIPNGPLNFYGQIRFLDPEILQGQTYQAFKSRYAEWEVRRTKNNRRGEYLHLVGYKNIPELMELIRPHAIRMKKSECLDLPDKIYQSQFFTLPKAHRELYDQVQTEALIELEGFFNYIPTFDTPEQKLIWMFDNVKGIEANTIKIDNALTKAIRLKQVVSGFYVPIDGEAREIDGKFPKIDALMDLLENIDSPTIIWSIFTNLEHHIIAEAIGEKYGHESYRFYNGKVNKDNKYINYKAFERGEFNYFIMNNNSGSRGLTLNNAAYHIFYSQNLDAEIRGQAEDRSHRIGQDKNVTYIDLMAINTIDAPNLVRLMEKIAQSDSILSELEPDRVSEDDMSPDEINRANAINKLLEME